MKVSVTYSVIVRSKGENYSSSSIFLPLKDVLAKDQHRSADQGVSTEVGRGWVISLNHKNIPQDKSLQRLLNGPTDYEECRGRL